MIQTRVVFVSGILVAKNEKGNVWAFPFVASFRFNSEIVTSWSPSNRGSSIIASAVSYLLYLHREASYSWIPQTCWRKSATRLDRAQPSSRSLVTRFKQKVRQWFRSLRWPTASAPAEEVIHR